MFVIKNKKWFLGISALLVLGALAVITIKGVDYGTEFTGGTVTEVSYENQTTFTEVTSSLQELGFTDAVVQPFGENGYIIRSQNLTEPQRQSLLAALEIDGTRNYELERYNSIGPSVGRQLQTKSLYALIAVSIGIILFIAYAFRKVARPVSSWKYGLVAVIALLHDIIIPVGILTFLGVEIDTLYVVGLLSILGLSVNDTIVVFDRIRETLQDEKAKNKPFPSVVGEAIKSTLTRSLLTSLTLVVVLVALYFFGPAATQTLSLVLLIGTIIGTYSSIFLASPLLTTLVSKKVGNKK
tara:strand:+ start:1210 stop:2100 length:891 start_codon:yes stop_codon:yes gene_type:complete